MKRPAGNRILMLLENRPYPQDLRVRREANALRAAGYQVAVICPIDTGQPFRETVDGVSVYRYPAPPDANGLFAYLWEYGYSMFFSFLLSVRVFFAEGFDVVHAHNPPDTFVFIAVFYKFFGKRFDEFIAVSRQQQLLKPCRALERCAIRHFAGSIDDIARVLGSPGSDTVIIFQ